METPPRRVGRGVVVAVVGAACSARNSAEVASLTDEVATSSDATRTDVGDPLLAFAARMRDNGLDDFADPIVERNGNVEFPNQAEPGIKDTFSAAFAVCGASLVGTVLGVSKTDADVVEWVDKLVEFALCVRGAGLDMPDPDLSGQFDKIEKRDSPEFSAADEQCDDGLGASGGSKQRQTTDPPMTTPLCTRVDVRPGGCDLPPSPHIFTGMEMGAVACPYV
jgi:hypothetical protein